MINPIQSEEHRTLLRESELFGRLEPAAIDAVLGHAAWLSVPGGWPLFLRGEPSNALYVLKSGSMGVFRGTADVQDGSDLLGMVAAGECIGELGLLAERRRQHTVRALRDSELLYLDREDFENILREHPAVALGAARVTTKRLLARTQPESVGAPRTFALLAFNTDVPAARIAERMARALDPYGNCLIIKAAQGRERDSNWFAERESHVRFVLYVDAGDDPAWRRLCLRQADALLLLANAAGAAAPWQGTTLAQSGPRYRPRHLLLVHENGSIELGAARRWLAEFHGPIRHHHLCNDADIARMTRLLSGHGTGLVLSGGGARGFAQIGVIRALREAGIEIDAIGGSSIGSIIGAGVASGWDDAKMQRKYRRAFVDGKPLGDWTLPLVALTRGGRTSRLLHEAFGECGIEDLPLPFFCVSANLSDGHAVVHRQGRLWFWLRASSAVPGILPPVFHDGEIFADGALVNNLPTDVMRADGVRNIIAIDISGDDALYAAVEEYASPGAWRLLWQRWHKPLRPSVVSILLRAGMLNSGTAKQDRRELASRYLAPNLQGFGLLDWQAYEELIELGYRYARAALASD